MAATTHDRTGAGGEYWPALDGLRGLALVAVFVHHVGWLDGGFLGVSLFFTLSGFLITTLLLADRRSDGRVRLRRFWWRRIRRLMPAALLTVGAVWAIEAAASSGSVDRSVTLDLRAAATWLANWRFALAETSYADQFTDPSPVLHFWSLAIEEQFYVAFPLLVAGLAVVARPSAARTLRLLFAAGVAASLTWSTVLVGGAGFDRAYFDTFARASELLVGALAAVVVGSWRPSGASARRLDLAGAVALTALAVSWFAIDLGDAWLARGGFAVHAVLAALVVLAARTPTLTVSRLLAWGPLRAVGLASYGAYLYHWPVIQYLDADVVGTDDVPLAAVQAAVTASLAWLSYHWIEQPIRRGRVPSVRARPVAASALAGATLTAALIVASPLSAVEPTQGTDATADLAVAETGPPTSVVLRGDLAEPPTTEVTGATEATETGEAILSTDTPPGVLSGEAWSPPPVEGVPRIAVIGDSVVNNFAEGLARWAERNGGLAVLVRSFPGCTVLDIAPIFQPWAPDEPLETACFTYEGLVQEFSAAGVDTVVIGSSGIDALPRMHDGDWAEIGSSPAYDQRLRDEYERLFATMHRAGFGVVWLNKPCGADPQREDRLGGRSSSEYLVEEIQDPVLARHPEIPVLDVASVACPGGAFTDTIGPVTDARPDGGHFTPAAADWIADTFLAPTLLDLHRP